MPLQPVNRRSVPDEVFDQVLSEVVEGGLEPGEALPERAPARRGARRLPARRPRGAAADGADPAGRGPPRRRDHGPRLPARRRPRPAPPAAGPPRRRSTSRVARSVLEARLAVGPAVAALAAQRGGPALAAQLTETIDALAATDDDVEPPAARAHLLGPDRRRRRLAGVPADVQQPAGGVRTGAGGAGPADGGRGRADRRLPGAGRGPRRGRPRHRARRRRAGAAAGDRRACSPRSSRPRRTSGDQGIPRGRGPAAAAAGRRRVPDRRAAPGRGVRRSRSAAPGAPSGGHPRPG